MIESSAFLLRVLTYGVLIWNCCATVTVYSGQFVKYQIEKKNYGSNPLLKVQDINFNFTTEDGYPSLPSWLRLEQRYDYSPAFIYGTPGQSDKSATVEIIGWDKKFYTTERKMTEFQVETNPGGFPWFQAEFLIMNMNFDDFLAKDSDTTILKIVKDHYWPAKDLQLTLVESALNRGGRIPLPKSNGYEGVYVRVGSNKSWNDTDGKATLQAGRRPSTDYFLENSHNYTINWSSFSWLDLRKMRSPEAQRQKLLPKDKIVTTTDYAPRKFDDSPRDFDNDFILIVIIPIIIIIILVLLLSIVMCCGREGRKKRDGQTPRMQLTHHHNIQRSTLRLRELSKPSDHDQTAPETPSSEHHSRPPRHENEYEKVPGEEEDERTDGRNAPPPYRMPPGGGTSGPGQQV